MSFTFGFVKVVVRLYYYHYYYYYYYLYILFHFNLYGKKFIHVVLWADGDQSSQRPNPFPALGTRLIVFSMKNLEIDLNLAFDDKKIKVISYI